MNYFLLITVALYLGAAGQSAWEGRWHMAGVFVAYAAANFMLMGVR